MKTITLLFALLLALSMTLGHADAQPTAFEKALYDKARYQVASQLNDDDLLSYCTTMNLGGDSLLKLHDEVIYKQTELDALLKQGLTGDNGQVSALETELANLKAQQAIKIFEVRKGLEVESKVAEVTLASLSQYQK